MADKTSGEREGSGGVVAVVALGIFEQPRVNIANEILQKDLRALHKLEKGDGLSGRCFRDDKKLLKIMPRRESSSLANTHAKEKLMRRILITAGLFALAIEPFTAHGQTAYPTKAIRIVVPITTGGPSDLVARMLGEKLSASLGKPVVVENRPGASQSVGMAVVAQADPDGYTLLQASANMATNPIFVPDARYDTVKDFAPVSLTHLTPYIFVVSSQSPVKSLAELVKSIKENPGKVSFASVGAGSPLQLAALLFAHTAGLKDLMEVEYKGSTNAHPDLIANRISFMVDPIAASGGHVKGGRMRALAVSTPQRNPAFSDIPTAAEAGVPGYDFSSWGGMYAPAGTPRPVIQKLNTEIGVALSSPDILKRFSDLSLIAKHTTPEDLGKFLDSEIIRWRTVLVKKP